jgi:hypothetical protein
MAMQSRAATSETTTVERCMNGKIKLLSTRKRSYLGNNRTLCTSLVPTMAGSRAL